MIFGNGRRDTWANGRDAGSDPVISDYARLNAAKPLDLRRDYGPGRETPVNIFPRRVKPSWVVAGIATVVLAGTCLVINHNNDIANGASFNDTSAPLGKDIIDEVIDSKLGSEYLVKLYGPLLSEKSITMINSVKWQKGADSDRTWNDISFLLNRLGAITDILRHHRDEKGNAIKLPQEAHDNLIEAARQLQSRGYLKDDIVEITEEHLRNRMINVIKIVDSPDVVEGAFSSPNVPKQNLVVSMAPGHAPMLVLA